MRVFGLTGGIASGKSTVARRFEALGVPVVYADQLARRAVEPGSTGLEAVVAAFGPSVLDTGGALDRRAVGARVFGDRDALRTLNSIVHPRVASLALEAFQELAAQGHELICYEVPLLVESGLAAAFRPVVVVAASEAAQIQRAISRDALTEAEARERIRAQLPLADKIAAADFVIHNDGTPQELEAKVDELLPPIRAWMAP